MKLFPAVPIVEGGLATTMFRRQWSGIPAAPGKVLNPLMPNLPIATQDGLPTRDFVLVWRSTRAVEINARVPMVYENGTPTEEFVRLWEKI